MPNISQQGFSPLAILILVVLGVFILWEITLTIENPFNSAQTQNSTSGQVNPSCTFPDPNDPCDTETGANFNL